MAEHDEDNRWGATEADISDEHGSDEPVGPEPTPSLGPVIPEGGFDPEVEESDEEAIVGVQPGEASDVPWNQEAPPESDEEVE